MGGIRNTFFLALTGRDEQSPPFLLVFEGNLACAIMWSEVAGLVYGKLVLDR